MRKRRKLVGVYSIVNLNNGKRYVGSAVDIASRWGVHEVCLRDGKHHSYKLQGAWRKHGEPAFLFEVLEFCRKGELATCEQCWMNHFEAFSKGYNVQPVARSPLGMKHSAEVRAKLSAAAKVRAASPEEKAIRSERAKRQHVEGRLGRKTWGPDAQARISAKTSLKLRGRKMSLETREKQSLSAKKRWERMSKEEKFRICSTRARGYWDNVTPEQLEKRRLACKDPERNAKISAGLRAYDAANPGALRGRFKSARGVV